MTQSARQTPQTGSLLATLRERREIGLLAFTGLLVIVVSIVEPRFLSAINLRNIMLWASILLVMSAGQMLAILTRGIDVSVGSMMGLSAMVMGLALRDFPGIPLVVAVLIALAVGSVLGLINGSLIALLRIPPIIVTLGTLNVYRGLCFIVGQGRQIDPDAIPTTLTSWSIDGVTPLGILPRVMLIPIITITIVWFLLAHTRSGRSIYAIGSNPEAAALLGLPVSRVLILVYTLGGCLAGLGGVLYASQFGTINPGNCGYGYELTVIAATVIGGVQIRGGAGTLSGVVLGSFLLAIINVSLSVTGLSGSIQLAVYGAVILVAVISEVYLRNEQEPA